MCNSPSVTLSRWEQRDEPNRALQAGALLSSMKTLSELGPPGALPADIGSPQKYAPVLTPQRTAAAGSAASAQMQATGGIPADEPGSLLWQ
eukprot:scaffold113496_cov66-Phaeocystis_antarctica.AAC.4